MVPILTAVLLAARAGPGEPLVWEPRLAPGDAWTLRVQQRSDLDQGLEVELWLQHDLALRVDAVGRDGAVQWTATPGAVHVAAQSDFGRVPDEQLAEAVALAPMRWTQRPDGSTEDLVIEGAGDSAAARVQQVLGGVASLIRLPAPTGPVPPGGAWTHDQQLALSLGLDEGSLDLALELRASITFVGWTEHAGVQVAELAVASRITGRGVASVGGRERSLGQVARSASTVYLDPVSCTPVYVLARTRITQALAGRFDTETTVADSVTSLARLPSD